MLDNIVDNVNYCHIEITLHQLVNNNIIHQWNWCW